MVTFKSAYASGVKNVPVPAGSEVAAVRASVALTTGATTNDMIHFLELPEDCIPVDWMLDYDDLDGATSLVIDFGVIDSAGTAISTAEADGGDEWIDGGTNGQSAGLARMTAAVALKVVPGARRMIGAKIMTAAGTPQAGNISLTLWYRAAYLGA